MIYLEEVGDEGRVGYFHSFPAFLPASWSYEQLLLSTSTTINIANLLHVCERLHHTTTSYPVPASFRILASLMENIYN